MTVKNISKYHEMDTEELDKLGTRELVNALESSRGRVICSCGKGCHCGDEVLTDDDRLWNKQQAELKTRLKSVLETREDLTPADIPRKVEKKKMKY
jgi:hypothetical protein